MKPANSPKKSFVDKLLGAVRKPVTSQGALVYNTASPFKQESATTTQTVAPLQEPSFDREDFKRRITYNETRHMRDPYRAKSDIQHLNGTHDWGKYQANENTIKEWTGPWLDKQYDVESFLNDPDAQDRFFEEYMNVAEAYKMKPEEAAIVWHRGWGVLGNQETKAQRPQLLREYIDRQMADPENYKYLNSFRNAK